MDRGSGDRIRWRCDFREDAMLRQGLGALALLGALVSAASAQSNWQFKFQKDQHLEFRVHHETSVTEVVGGKKSETASRLEIAKKWRVLDVDSQGVATLELSLTALRNEQRRPSGEVLLFDSRDLIKSTPELRGMAKFLNTPIALIRVDRIGRVVEVKKGPADKYEAEPPFVVVLPMAQAAEGQAWVRPFTIALEPPLGAGEKYTAEQKASCAKIQNGRAVLAVTTAIKNMPDSPGEQVPLIQKQMAGQVIVDLDRGCLEQVQLSVDRTVENHQGQGSSYRFASNYAESIMTPGGIIPAGGTR
jgi:hypothetical protein